MTSRTMKRVPPRKPAGLAAPAKRASDRAEQRKLATSEERTVLALESIADQLDLIHADLHSIDNFAREESGNLQALAAHVGCADAAADETSTSDLSSENPDGGRSAGARFMLGGVSYRNMQHPIAKADHAQQRAASAN